jgi:hypothetical protein
MVFLQRDRIVMARILSRCSIKKTETAMGPTRLNEDLAGHSNASNLQLNMKLRHIAIVLDGDFAF